MHLTVFHLRVRFIVERERLKTVERSLNGFVISRAQIH
jgi:hypothetical protein